MLGHSSESYIPTVTRTCQSPHVPSAMQINLVPFSQHVMFLLGLYLLATLPGLRPATVPPNHCTTKWIPPGYVDRTDAYRAVVPPHQHQWTPVIIVALSLKSDKLTKARIGLGSRYCVKLWATRCLLISIHTHISLLQEKYEFKIHIYVNSVYLLVAVETNVIMVPSYISEHGYTVTGETKYSTFVVYNMCGHLHLDKSFNCGSAEWLLISVNITKQ